MIRIATFNLENLFTRPSAMSFESDATGREAIEHHAIANNIIAKVAYTDADRVKLLELSAIYGWHRKTPPASALILLQKLRGQLFRDPVHGPVEVVANGRADWVGWFELRREEVAWQATRNTGRVIDEVGPDIMIAVEVDDRPTLVRFNEQVLKAGFQRDYPHLMVIDGNDQRGIDLGILSRFPIEVMRSHVDDPSPAGGTLFSRDCPEYDIRLPNGDLIVVIPNHFKSKRSGNDQTSQERRKAQAHGAHAAAVAALARTPHVIVGGDLNDTPDSLPLVDMFKDDFRDVISHPTYPTDRPGTYETGLATQKLDYLILSPALFPLLDRTGIERRGSYHPHTWDAFDTVTSSVDEASDHHMVWADLNIGP